MVVLAPASAPEAYDLATRLIPDTALGIWPESLHPGRLAEALRGACWWLPSNIVEIVEAAAETMPAPDGPLAASMIPAPSGAIWFAQPVSLSELGEWFDDDELDEWFDEDEDGPGASVDMYAMSWCVVANPTTNRVMVEVVSWCSLNRKAVRAIYANTGRNPVGLMPIRSAVLPASPDVAAMIGLDPADFVAADTTGFWENEDLTDDRILLATWVLGTEVLAAEVSQVPRGERRRRGRTSTQTPQLTVTTLRRRGHSNGGGSGGGSLSVQFVVSGHWRWQPCGPGRSQRKLTWIAPHLKGPDDAPLSEPARAARLIR